MKDNIITLVTQQANDEPDEETIAELEELLEHARTGVVQGFSISIVCSDNSMGTFFTQSVKNHIFASIGSVSYLKRRLLDVIEHE